MLIKEYDLGDDVTCWAEFRNTSGALADPDVVSFSFRAPASATVTTYTYGMHAQLVRDSLGKFHVIVDGNAVGLWNYRFFSTGAVKAASEGLFKVKKSNFG